MLSLPENISLLKKNSSYAINLYKDRVSGNKTCDHVTTTTKNLRTGYYYIIPCDFKS